MFQSPILRGIIPCFGDFNFIISYSVDSDGSLVLMEAIDLVNSAQISSNLNFPTWILDCDFHSPALFDFFLSSYSSVCSTITFPPLGNADLVFLSVSIDFLSNSKQDTIFHHIAYDYSQADWDDLGHHFRDAHGRISINSMLPLLQRWVRFEVRP